jgi:hypothetical protein
MYMNKGIFSVLQWTQQLESGHTQQGEFIQQWQNLENS